MTITPKEYRDIAASAEAGTPMLAALPSLDYHATIGLMVSKAAIDQDVPALMAALGSTLAKLLAGIPDEAVIGALNTIYAGCQMHRQELAEFIATGMAVDAVDKAAKKDSDEPTSTS